MVEELVGFGRLSVNMARSDRSVGTAGVAWRALGAAGVAGGKAGASGGADRAM